ncbi:ABC transporter ATP-binding protein [Halostagnicola sp. A-GB9-2]|uniref:ABC transporter ATP-binding protein n=1 Tax=Halostagnicola sp. A-GB9-2 TaxID=3048066 RepID=UPI0024BF3AD6|nr:ABC transporter ATP-binding protein [Halostagnicola sp. A-GB9-2]MDJ1434762.1 ABC transporter ATP-binding protein [Halostagnicola sp. A-GB9-2]
MSLLELDDVHSHYGPSHILRGVSLTVERGEVVTLLGRNGAGKTTTLRSIIGATPPEVSAGRIAFGGEDIVGNSPEDIVMNGIAIVPEERRVFGDFTVEENLRMPDISRQDWNTILRDMPVEDESGMNDEEIYELFPRLEERREQYAGTLSGGEQQMLSIARTLKLPNVDLLLMDEPTEGLAPQIVESVLDSIERIAETGTTILLVEQNSTAALKVADRCYILDDGSIVYQGSSEELVADDDVRLRYLAV